MQISWSKAKSQFELSLAQYSPSLFQNQLLHFTCSFPGGIIKKNSTESPYKIYLHKQIQQRPHFQKMVLRNFLKWRLTSSPVEPVDGEEEDAEILVVKQPPPLISTF